MLRCTRLLRVMDKNYRWHTYFRMKPVKRQSVTDSGRLMTAGALGDTRLTDPAKYQSGRLHDRLRTERAMGEVQGRLEAGVARGVVGDNRVLALRDFDGPTTTAERLLADRIDAKDIGFGAGGEDGALPGSSPASRSDQIDRDLSVRGVTDRVATRTVQQLRESDTARLRMQVKHPMLPNPRKYDKLAQAHQRDETDDGRAARLRDRLAMEHGVVNRGRVDAFMLDDDTIFPLWVRNLAPSIKDRVMFGGLGLTDEDESTRQNLLRLPRQEREAEWTRIKAAKAYELGEEKRVSPYELRRERMGKRKYYALAAAQQKKQSRIKAMTLRRPEEWDVAPVAGVDYSARLALVAKHVEANIKTNGQWPLSDEKLDVAMRRQARNAAKESFLQKAGKDFDVTLNRVSPGLREAIRTVGTKERPVKRISRRDYKFRLQAVRDGNQDEHGRKFMQLSRQARQRHSTALSMEEAQEARRTARTKEMNGLGAQPRFDTHWPGAYQRESLAFEVGRQTVWDPSKGRAE
jgi:hypothetical protein